MIINSMLRANIMAILVITIIIYVPSFPLMWTTTIIITTTTSTIIIPGCTGFPLM